MAPGGEEGRDKLRKSAGIGKYDLIRRYPNGTTHPDISLDIPDKTGRLTRGTETSKYPEEKKTTVILRVAASEMGIAQIRLVSAGRR